MSRPKPTILVQYVCPNTLKAVQILKAESIYAVFYDGRPFNLKDVDTMSDDVGAKYRKTSFANPGHAYNLSERLNEQFKTNKFTVHRLDNGPEVFEHE